MFAPNSFQSSGVSFSAEGGSALFFKGGGQLKTDG